MGSDLKYNISASIQQFSHGNLFENALKVFRSLNYPIPIQSPLDDPSWNGLKETFLQNKPINEKLALTEDWKYFNILFQLTESSMQNQVDIFSSDRVDNSVMQSFLFLILELKEEHYTKSQLSNITREINKIFAMPAIILFKTGDCLTLSVIHRRIHKRDEGKDVLEKVTLIKDISISKPHRAHIEILFDLSFNELQRKYGFTNFVELHQAWQKTLDIKELNKRFFRELFNWYHWAVRKVRFPNKVNDDKDDMQFNQEAVIRLLTRLIFVWFIKEKGLVPEKLFDPRMLIDVLKHFNPDSKDSAEYYRAILQNLFFATLNTPMDRDINDSNRDEKRSFIDPGMKSGKANPDYTNQIRYRYKEYFTHEDQALDLFATIPFLNGGLFECLDYAPEDGQPELRIDGFSTKPHKQAFVPNALFFADEFLFDLNDEYGTKNKQYKVKGLINIFNGYKFTITENTPLEEEVALDPELLGKVFENLLATYNPETKTTARKQTGSFYTPREIVNYMVDESLIAYLANILDSEDRIRILFSSAESQHDFNEEESRRLTHALSHCRILDPACGSGAFPMGILHRMVDLLKKLDPDNIHWKEIQKERAIQETKEAYDIGGQEERKHRLDEINKAFDESMNNPDYARKLFLIENCIYGVDIQQVAVQIAKLRFFISLVAEQKVDDSRPNRNILSMPNLETKFVAANTLIALEKPAGQLSLMSMNPAIEAKEKELKKLREKIFFTRRYHDKKKLKKEEKRCREELKKVLIESNMTKTAAEQMAGWNPFDPLASSPYFDIETMFGFEGGFDVLIGNPPYKVVNKIEQALYLNYQTINCGDLFAYFFEKAIKDNLKQNGAISFITSSLYIKGLKFEALRQYLEDNIDLKSLIIQGDDVFDNVQMPTATFIGIKNVLQYTWKFNNYIKNFDLIKKIDENSITLDRISKIMRGFEIGRDKVRDVGQIPFITGSDIDHWIIKRERYISKMIETQFQKEKSFFIGKRVLVRETGNDLIGLFILKKLYCNRSLYSIKIQNEKSYSCEYITSLLNSDLFQFYYQCRFKNETEIFPKIRIAQVKLLPIKQTERIELFQSLVSYIQFLLSKNNNELLRYFLRLINAIIYQIYFPAEIQSAGCEVLKHLHHLPELKEGWDDSKKLAVIEEVYWELSDPSHPVSVAMERMKEVEEVRVIEEAVGRGKMKNE